jgi:hypothetical protein
LTQESRCRYCKAPIVWLRTARGKMVPLEPQRRLVYTDEGVLVQGRESHYAYCPYARRIRGLQQVKRRREYANDRGRPDQQSRGAPDPGA